MALERESVGCQKRAGGPGGATGTSGAAPPLSRAAAPPTPRIAHARARTGRLTRRIRRRWWSQILSLSDVAPRPACPCPGANVGAAGEPRGGGARRVPPRGDREGRVVRAGRRGGHELAGSVPGGPHGGPAAAAQVTPGTPPRAARPGGAGEARGPRRWGRKRPAERGDPGFPRPGARREGAERARPGDPVRGGNAECGGAHAPGAGPSPLAPSTSTIDTPSSAPLPPAGTARSLGWRRWSWCPCPSPTTSTWASKMNTNCSSW